LDGAIQITQRDEMSYQEMMAHPAMFLHPEPRNVLIVGGGDGGVAREVLKHKSVEKVTLCEIDGDVVETAKQYLPEIVSAVKLFFVCFVLFCFVLFCCY
jgi:spermidine synthase